MALNDCCIWGCAKAPQLGMANFHPDSSRLSVNLKQGTEKWCKRECCCLRAVSGFESSGDADRIRVQPSVLLEGFHKDANIINSEFYLNIPQFEF